MSLTKPKKILSIDPGISGAFALASPTKLIKTWKMPPLDKEGLPDLQAIFSFASKHKSYIILEEQSTRRGNSIRSAFNHGKGYGYLLCLIHSSGLDFELVSPKGKEGWINSIPEINPAHNYPHKTKKTKIKTSEFAIANYSNSKNVIWGPRGGFNDGVADAIAMAAYYYKVK